MATSWIDILGAGLSGGLVVKGFDYIYQEYLRRSKARKTAKDLIDRHIDPILKSSDELVGKIRSLAQSDFTELNKAERPSGSDFEEWCPYLDIIYLFSQFWSWIQILRIEGLFVNIGADERGKKLLSFFRALESTKTRLLARSWQRAIGETLLKQTGNGLRTLTYPEFVECFLSKNEFRRWYKPFISVLTRLNHTRERQRFLIYGAIIHALIDTLDNDHLVTRYKPGWPNKLSKKSKRSLRYRVFRIYLPFVENYSQYLKIGKWHG